MKAVITPPQFLRKVTQKKSQQLHLSHCKTKQPWQHRTYSTTSNTPIVTKVDTHTPAEMFPTFENTLDNYRKTQSILKHFDIKSVFRSSGTLKIFSPINGGELGTVEVDTKETVEKKVSLSQAAFEEWKTIPAPARGELIRLFGEQLRNNKSMLGALITIETGKIKTEGLGEVQEMIDICDYSVGLSRTMSGQTIKSERPETEMETNWNPLGPVGVISAFNFPAAVWAWNASLSLACGNTLLWKPSEKTPFSALATQVLLDKAFEQFGDVNFQKANQRFFRQHNTSLANAISQLVIGERDIGELLVDDLRIPLISATGSIPMGRAVSQRVAGRFGKSILELGGNNAVIVENDANLDLALPAILFGAMGTTGQRCTTTRRLFVHEDVYEKVVGSLKAAYQSVIESGKIGNPFDDKTLIGPLIDQRAVMSMQHALEKAAQEGGSVFFGNVIKGNFVQPALVEMPRQTSIVREETFAPILYIMKYKDLKEAIALNNEVDAGLSSSIFTTSNNKEALFKRESDCGIVNVNIGTSGAEIGGPFGGNKATGWGREAGGDSWKEYVRWRTSTSYRGNNAPPLAQGVTFNVGK